jgi:hypothetical protein
MILVDLFFRLCSYCACIIIIIVVVVVVIIIMLVYWTTTHIDGGLESSG